MCGIGGICDLTATSRADEMRSVVDRMATSMYHRGPDANGLFVDNGIALAHTRLSILELGELGSQPMTSANGRYTLSYNGELYNYRELRVELQQQGCHFKSASDTEVVLQALLTWGRGALARFNGMFALALWDAAEQSLVLARDRFGIKPLYYTEHAGQMYFASDINALLDVGALRRQLGFSGLASYLYFGNALGENTLYRDCFKLPAAHTLTVRPAENKKAAFSIEPYWQATDIALQQPPESQAVEQVRQLLHASVKRHLASDVPVGLFLSGGLDSSTLCALAAQHYEGKLATYSVAFEGATAHSELQVARDVAAQFGTDHHELNISYENLAAVLGEMTRAHAQPFGDAANVPLYLLTRELPAGMKVILQGDGGDEVFGGYKRYRMLRHAGLCKRICQLPLLERDIHWPASVLRRGHRMLRALGSASDANRCALLLTEEPSAASVDVLLNPAVRAQLTHQVAFQRYTDVVGSMPQAVSGDPQQLMLWTDMQILLADLFLEKVDRSTMASSVEVRVPFLDTELTDYVMGLPASMKLTGQSKHLLRQAMRQTLPDAVLHGPKYGFGVPYAEWLRGPLAAFTEQRLLDGGSMMTQLFDREALAGLCKQHQQGKGDRGFMLYKLLMLSMWAEQYQVSL